MTRSAEIPAPAVQPPAAEPATEPPGRRGDAEPGAAGLRISRRGFLALLAHPLVFDLESDR